MLLEIRHLTQYHYAEPVRESVMELWMQPWKGAGQRLISFELDLDPAARLFSYADPYGNAVYHFDVPQPHDRLDILARAAVETQAPLALPDRLDSGEWDRLRSDFVRGEHLDFLRPHGFVENTAALAAFIDKHGLEDLRRGDPLNAVRAVSKAIHDSLDYQAGATTAESRIDEALGLGRGVCQDFSHIMIAILRSWGIPARYVSGYLFTDRELGDRSDPDATHAWVEVFLPSLRWVGIDPTNNTIAGERHVTVAVGRDYDDVPPSRGVYKGDAESQLAVAVSVRRARAALAEPEFLRVAKPAFSNVRRRPAGAFNHDQHQQQQQ
jgi:transglutaminase-like putative cysteine protease